MQQSLLCENFAEFPRITDHRAAPQASCANGRGPMWPAAFLSGTAATLRVVG